MASYYVWSAAAGSANGTSWANAYTTLTLAFSGKVAGDTFYVAHDHAESTAASITLTTVGTSANPSKVVCANRAGSVPPVAADLRATATVTTTGGSHINFVGNTHYDGIIFSAGTGGSAAHIIIPSAGTSTSFRFDNCSLRLVNTSTGAKIYFGNAGSFAATYVELNNTTASFASVNQTIDVSCMVRWRNTPTALLGTMPTTLLNFANVGRGGWIECLGVDFSAAGSGKTIINATATAIACTARFVDCKLDAAATKSAAPVNIGSFETDFIRSSATGNYAVARYRVSGTLTEETTIVRTGGATDGTTPIAWKVVTTATCSYSLPFETPPIAIWNDTTGSAKTATIECVWGGGAVPNDDEIWVDVEYLGNATAPQGSFVNDGKASVLATAAGQTTSSETWGGSTTKFKLNVTFTAQQKGWIYARVKVGKLSSTFYIDPLITLT